MNRRCRTLLSTVLNTAYGAVLCACSGSAPSASGAFKVALLTPGPVSDQSWNGGAYDGLLAIRDSLSATISNIETKTPAEFEENFRQYGAQGYSLVFGHGFEFQDAAKRVAPEFPKTVYITTSGTVSGPNLASMAFGFSDASYLAGVVAGSMTRTGKIGVIGGTELPPVRESFLAFEQGARSARPSVKLITSYIGNWDDVSAGKESAIAQLSQGVDVIFQNADAAGLGIFQAVKEAHGAWVFGTNSNQNSLAPDVTIGSVVINLPLAFLTVAREVKSGSFKPRVVEMGTASRVVTLVLNPKLQAKIPSAARSRVDSLQSLMFAGKFTVGHPTAPATGR